MTKPTFALIGCGYVGPKHARAIKQAGGTLKAANDMHDNVGWLDKDWMGCAFTCEPLDADMDPCELPSWSTRWAERANPDWIVIATPNDMHAVMIERYLPLAKVGVICEKPMFLSTEDLETLDSLRGSCGKRLHTILNLRHSGPALRAREWARQNAPSIVDITYISPRGEWYEKSWKEDQKRSGGIIFNLGIHILDWIVWTFGTPSKATLTEDVSDGVVINLAYAEGVSHAFYGECEIKIVLSTSMDHQPERTIRMTKGDECGRVFDLTNEFAELHTECYREILAGGGPGIEDARPSIALAQELTKGLS